ncbi:MAG: septation regulator SpoVG [Acetobacteraceae bacterium]|nr:septation regulator SpoVG [Acetobacteraceae bacterium]
MQVTDVRVWRVEGEGKVRASASITLDGEFVVHDIRVVEGQNGLFVAMPSRRTRQGDFRDVAHPVTPDANERITAAVMTAFRQLQE